MDRTGRRRKRKCLYCICPHFVCGSGAEKPNYLPS